MLCWSLRGASSAIIQSKDAHIWSIHIWGKRIWQPYNVFTVQCSMSNAQRPDGLVVISDYKESIIKRSIKATHLTGININSSTGLHKTIEQHLFGYVYYRSKIRTFILLIACGTYLLTDMSKHMESRLVARDIGCLSRLSWVISRQHHASRQH